MERVRVMYFHFFVYMCIPSLAHDYFLWTTTNPKICNPSFLIRQNIIQDVRLTYSQLLTMIYLREILDEAGRYWVVIGSLFY